MSGPVRGGAPEKEVGTSGHGFGVDSFFILIGILLLSFGPYLLLAMIRGVVKADTFTTLTCLALTVLEAWILIRLGRKRSTTWRIVVALTVAAAVVLSFWPDIRAARGDRKLVEEALEYFNEGKYDAAQSHIEWKKFKYTYAKTVFGATAYDFPACEAMNDLCISHDYYKWGNIDSAYQILPKDAKYCEYDLEYMEKVRQEWLDTADERAAAAKERKQKRLEDEKAYEESVRNASMPFTRMLESDISRTGLGHYTSRKTTYEKKKVPKGYSDKGTEITTYYWKQLGEVVCEVVCKYDRVSEVHYYGLPATREHFAKQSRDTGTGGDPFGVNDYDDPEEFYADNADAFEDYEEAEDYFYENGR